MSELRVSQPLASGHVKQLDLNPTASSWGEGAKGSRHSLIASARCAVSRTDWPEREAAGLLRVMMLEVLSWECSPVMALVEVEGMVFKVVTVEGRHVLHVMTVEEGWQPLVRLSGLGVYLEEGLVVPVGPFIPGVVGGPNAETRAWRAGVLDEQ